MRLASLTLFALLFLSSQSSADIIHLKNGRTIECISATQDEAYVRYVVQGGKMTIPKSMVVNIEKTKVEIKPQQTSSESLQPEIGTDQRKALPAKVEAQSKSPAKNPIKNIQNGRTRNVVLAGKLEDYLKAYQQNRNERTTMDLALAYFLARDDGSAEQYFQDALKMNPSNPDALYYLGEISWRREDLDQAQNYWQKAYNLDPDPELKQRLDSLAKEHKAAETFEKDTSSHFLIRYDGGVADSSLVSEMSEYLETVYQELSQRFEAFPAEPFVVVLYPKQTFFDVTDMPAWSGGANDGKIKLPVKGSTSLTDEMKSVLTHELTHSFVRFKAADNYPVWLQEGLAQYSEGKRAEGEERAILQELIANNQLPAIEKLSGSFLGASSDAANILYLYSLSFTEYLLDKYPFYQMNELLEQLGKGKRINEAFEIVYEVSMADLEEQYRQDLANQ